MMHISQILRLKVANEELWTACAGWRRQWKHWGGLLDAERYINGSFMDIDFVRYVEEAAY